jgi:hypothetical protein
MKLLKILPYLIVSFGSLAVAETPARAGVIRGTGFAETVDAFSAFIDHGSIDFPAFHDLVAPMPNFWDVEFKISESAGGGIIPDIVVVDVTSQHLVRVPGHGDAEIQPNIGVALRVSSLGPLSQLIEIAHPFVPNHTDQFLLTLAPTFAANGLDILSYSVDITGVHCASLCPIPPDARQNGEPLVPVPEPTSTLSLLALGTLGAASTLKRKLKSAKSTEKETTKLG